MSRRIIWSVLVLAAAGWTLPAVAVAPADRAELSPPTPPAEIEPAPLLPADADTSLFLRRGDGPRAFGRVQEEGQRPFGGVARSPLRVQWFHPADDERADAGWLGLQLAPVPAAVASHLKLDDAGLIVNNLFKDGPADKAGMQQYDVIIEVDGEKVSPDVRAFAEHIRGHKPGSEVTLTVYRQGRKQSVEVTLGETPDRMDDQTLRFEDDPDLAHRRSFDIRGRILRPGPEGWVLDEFGELPDLEHLDRWIGRWDDGRRGPEVQEGRRVTRDGHVLHVRREKDGTIVVRRYEQGEEPDAETKAEVKTYRNMEELRDGDPEAYGLLRSSGRMGPVDEAVKKYQEAVREYMDKLLKEHHRAVPAPPTLPGVPRGKAEHEFRNRLFQAFPKEVQPRDVDQYETAPSAEAEARFEAHPDGSITVEVQDGPTQLRMTFGSEEKFKAESPRLYERYKVMRDRFR